MDALIVILLAINIISLIFAPMPLASGEYKYFNLVNPKVIYEAIPVNWFGVILLTIIFNACFLIVSVPYWIYKICTVGRKCDTK